MTQPPPPTEPAGRALQRVRNRHVSGTDGLCTDCGQTWPCGTIQDADGPPQGDVVATAINRLSTLVAVWAQQPPASFADMRRQAREAVDGPQPSPPSAPQGGTRGDTGQQPPLDQVDDPR